MAEIYQISPLMLLVEVEDMEDMVVMENMQVVLELEDVVAAVVMVGMEEMVVEILLVAVTMMEVGVEVVMAEEQMAVMLAVEVEDILRKGETAHMEEEHLMEEEEEAMVEILFILVQMGFMAVEVVAVLMMEVMAEMEYV